MSNEFLQEALKYAALGIPVFPCLPGRKSPSNENGFKGATTDPDKIRKWWSESPKAGIGVATGSFIPTQPDMAVRSSDDRSTMNDCVDSKKRSGLVILDIDPEKSGQDSLDWYLAKHGPLPKTVTSKTGGGGLHYLFHYPGYFVPSSQNKVAPGIDIRADRGYAVMPPSRHPGGGTYQWLHSLDDVALADTPQWLLNRIRDTQEDESSAANVHSGQMTHFDNKTVVLDNKGDREGSELGSIPPVAARDRAIAYIENSPGAISESDGHKTTFWLATALIHGFLLDPDIALQILSTHHNPRAYA